MRERSGRSVVLIARGGEAVSWVGKRKRSVDYQTITSCGVAQMLLALRIRTKGGGHRICDLTSCNILRDERGGSSGRGDGKLLWKCC